MSADRWTDCFTLLCYMPEYDIILCCAHILTLQNTTTIVSILYAINYIMVYDGCGYVWTSLEYK